MKLQFSATEDLEAYNGYDGSGFESPAVSAVDGGELDVSDDKGAQLLADFPDNFSKKAASAPKALATKVEPTATKRGRRK